MKDLITVINQNPQGCARLTEPNPDKAEKCFGKNRARDRKHRVDDNHTHRIGIRCFRMIFREFVPKIRAAKTNS